MMAWPCRFKRKIWNYVGKDDRGADIGCGALPLENTEGFDLPNFDANEPFPWPDAHWDYIFSAHCLEDLTDWQKSLREMMRCVRVDGYLFLHLPLEINGCDCGNAAHLHVIRAQEVIEVIESDPTWRMLAVYWPEHPYGTAHSSCAYIARRFPEGYTNRNGQHDYPEYAWCGPNNVSPPWEET